MFEELDRILHQPIRTRIVAYLLTMEGADFSQLKKELQLTDGHMTTHMRELLESGYVAAEKSMLNGKSNTRYTVTPSGKKAFTAYVAMLKKIIDLST